MSLNTVPQSIIKTQPHVNQAKPMYLFKTGKQSAELQRQRVSMALSILESEKDFLMLNPDLHERITGLDYELTEQKVGAYIIDDSLPF